MKVIIAGSRSITDRELVARAIVESKFDITGVVCGEARGVDLEGKCWAQEHGIQVYYYPAAWRTAAGSYDRAAGFTRNIAMARFADALIAVHDGVSPGTRHMIRYMTKLNKPVYVLLSKGGAEIAAIENRLREQAGKMVFDERGNAL